MKINFHRLNHFQICIPIGEENNARQFYCGLLGLKEIEKPDFLKVRGGFWLEVADIELHIGTEKMEGTSKRHPAFEIDNLEEVKQYFVDAKIELRESKPLPKFNRFSIYDPYGNRIEFLEEIKT